ncbi:hypothetical protein EUGRSUZ_L03275 [Eucalyptus grandis]|uniref:NAD-dependent epimerase/dehydratase domain-containing protein n=1 Tax=Eucalyptus grandis TaxID=71139 RepID=A0AAD9T8Q5_EUCGR|nr:hypothetical protein EUGRSUZ_L03275 [Eucalyptus grandis]
MSAAVGAEKTVCVTGASGCIASCLVKLLLQRRYTVKASVRHPKGSFDPVVEGCAGVFHTASPFYHDVKDPQVWFQNSYASAPTFPDESCGWVDVKDVANAHTPAFEVPSARGRYCLVECVSHYDDEPYTPVYWVSMEKVKSLGIDYVPLERSPKETVESLKEKGFVKFWQKILPSQKFPRRTSQGRHQTCFGL